METGEFHWTDGWYFKRNDDGSVRIRKEGDGASSGLPNRAVATIPALEWVSIVSHCTAGGESANYEKVRALVLNEVREEECAAIIAWLRDVGAGPSLTASALRKAADDLEKGAHLK